MAEDSTEELPSVEELMQRIAENYESLPRQLKSVATYLEQHAGPHDGDLDSPGLVLAFEDGGELDVAGLARTGSGEIPPAVHPRDRLLAVDGLSVTGATRGKVFDALRGKPGQSRNLRIERDGRTMSLDAPIRHLL